MKYSEKAVERWAKSLLPCPSPEHEHHVEHGFCGACGESKKITIIPGESASFWRGRDGEVIAGIVNNTLHVLLPDRVK